MVSIDEHCKACLDEFGEEFRPFHELIDCYHNLQGRDSEGEFDYTGEWCVRHKEKIHTREFVEIIAEMYGDRATEAMILHLHQDFEGTEFENYIPSKDDYKQIGFWSRMQGFRRD